MISVACVRIATLVDDVAAIRAYARLGFRPLGVMREYTRDLDGVGTGW